MAPGRSGLFWPLIGYRPTPKGAMAYRFMGRRNEHLKLFGQVADAVGFGLSEEYAALGSPAAVDLLGTIGENTFNGGPPSSFSLPPFGPPCCEGSSDPQRDQPLKALLGAHGLNIRQDGLVDLLRGGPLCGEVGPLGEEAVGVVAVDVACVDGHNGIGDPAAGFPGAVGPEGEVALAVFHVDDVDGQVLWLQGQGVRLPAISL